MRFRWWRPTDVELFRTHSAAAWCEPGTIQWRSPDGGRVRLGDEDGAPFVVTRVVPLHPTRLLDGSYRECWQVYGRRA